MGTHLSGLLLLNVPPSPSLCDFSENIQDSTEDWLRLLVPVPERTEAARTSFPPSASLSKGLHESPAAQPVRGYSEVWPCQRQMRFFPSPSHIQPMVTSICCVAADQEPGQCRFRWSLSLWICSRWREDIYLWDDESVHERSELGDGGEGPEEGTLGRDPTSRRRRCLRQGCLVVGHVGGADPSHDTVISFAD